MIAREGQLRAVLQDDAILPMEPRLQFLNEIEPNYRGAMDAHKLPGIELRFQTTDCFTKQVGLLRAVDRNIIAFGFDPIDFAGLEKIDAPGRFDYEPLELVLTRLQLLQQRQDTLVHAAISVAQELRLRALPRNVEPFLVEWF